MPIQGYYACSVNSPRGFNCHAVDDPGGKDAEPGDDPRHRESTEEDFWRVSISGVLQQLGRLEEDVRAIVQEEDEGSDLEEVAGPREAHQQDGGHVVHEHDLK